MATPNVAYFARLVPLALVIVQGRSRPLCGTFNATSPQAKYICRPDSFPSLHRRHSSVEDQPRLRRAACVSRLHEKICVALLM
ncbi:hypothetical protein PoB_003336100 [Plakobranchus ocellatus]|uniref:Secreted protein n=1 Tax=Plakobranchus ocellatus TaxID=259542 RepID=A0AAV4AJR5_9GAST|nr:hypothetical protein PoB_003336100 [Plakobranchus ocellatus]